MAPSPTHVGIEASSSNKDRRVLRVDQLWSRKLKKFYFAKTQKEENHAKSFSKYALVVRRIISTKGLLAGTEIDIRSAHLGEVLRDIFQDAAGLKLTATPPTIEPRMLFHARNGLEERLTFETGKHDPNPDIIQDLQTALGFLNDEFSATKLNLQSMQAGGDITYDLLWALFPPNEEVFTEDNTLGEPQVLKFVSGEYKESRMEGEWYEVTGQIINHDGMDFGWGSISIKIPSFQGAMKTRDLNAFPLGVLHDKEGQIAQLCERGRNFVRLMKPAVQEYQGQALFEQPGMQGPEEKQFLATGRIMVDPVAFCAHNPNDELLRYPITPIGNREGVMTIREQHDHLFCSHRILGFSFAEKRWGSFAVSKISTVTWNTKAFEKLILAPEKRDIVRSLVESHGSNTEAFDDIVLGKGRGLVGLLSGGPGVGKTLTAEVVAELSRRPLYSVTAGELGSTTDAIDAKLGRVFSISARWGCVTLIDEADVFLYKRGDASLERNALCSIFLRRLEYFQGILILTTNRRRDIDQAFKSRIHFSFHYPPLEKHDRIKIWRTFLSSAASGNHDHQLSEEDFGQLAERNMNGREIKNAVSCAFSIVRARHEALTVSGIRAVLNVLMDDFSDDDKE